MARTSCLTKRIVLVALGLCVLSACKPKPGADDMAQQEDLSLPADLSQAPDLSSPEDLRLPEDLRPPTDLRPPADLLPPQDLAPGPGVRCGAMNCTAAQRCCGALNPTPMLSCQASCPAGSEADIACDAPEQCGGAAHCCAEAKVGVGTPPLCPLVGLKTTCQATCTGRIAPMCNMTAVARVCQKGAHCATDLANPNCCEFAGFPVPFCVDSTLKAAATRCL